MVTLVPTLALLLGSLAFLASLGCSPKNLPRIAPSCAPASAFDAGLVRYAIRDGAGLDPLGAYADEIREATTRARVFDSDSALFTRATPELRVSQVPPPDGEEPKQVALWANVEAAPAYARDGTAGDVEQPDAAFPEGTTIIREVRTDDDEPAPDEPAKIMVKLSPRYAPEMNDWWFGERDPVDHTVRAAATPCTCMGCHGMHADTDLVVGPPAVDAEPPVPGGAYGG